MYSWTDERCDYLRRLLGDGLPYSAIAAELGGVTRNACIGKAKRLGLTNGRARSDQLSRPRKPKEAKPKLARVQRISRAGRNHFAIIEMDEEPVLELSADEIPIDQRKTVATIGMDDCRWPYGDPGKPDFFFCGAAKLTGFPYCKYHTGIAYKKSPTRTLGEQEHARRAASARRRATEGQRWGSGGA